jgi:hypothetical protein
MALLVGHKAPENAALAADVPSAVRELALMIEDSRSQFATAARAHGADYKGGYWMMYLIAPVAVLSSATAIVAPSYSRILYGIEFLLIVSILLLFLAMRHGGWQELWVRARRTAEHLRYLPLVAPFVQSDSTNWYDVLAARHGMRISVDDEVTAVCAWLGQQNAARAFPLEEPVFCAGYLRYFDAVLAQQIQYHAINADLEHVLSRRISLASSAFFAITVFCTALLFLENLATSLGISRYLPPHYLRLCATVLPAIGAGLRGLLAQGESHRVAALSEGLALRLGQLRDQLKTLPGNAVASGELENLVWNAVQEMLSEADTWMRLQESVPLSMAG